MEEKTMEEIINHEQDNNKFLHALQYQEDLSVFINLITKYEAIVALPKIETIQKIPLTRQFIETHILIRKKDDLRKFMTLNGAVGTIQQFVSSGILDQNQISLTKKETEEKKTQNEKNKKKITFLQLLDPPPKEGQLLDLVKSKSYSELLSKTKRWDQIGSKKQNKFEIEQDDILVIARATGVLVRENVGINIIILNQPFTFEGCSWGQKKQKTTARTKTNVKQNSQIDNFLTNFKLKKTISQDPLIGEGNSKSEKENENENEGENKNKNENENENNDNENENDTKNGFKQRKIEDLYSQFNKGKNENENNHFKQIYNNIFLPQINKFINDFIEAFQDSKRAGEYIQNFISLMTKKIVSHFNQDANKISNKSKYKNLNILISEQLEEFIMEKVYDKSIDLIKLDLNEKNTLPFSDLFQKLGWIKLEHLGIDSNFINMDFINEACAKLQNIDLVKAPNQKLLCLMDSCKSISKSVISIEQSGNDTFLPLIIYTILQSKIGNLKLNIEYIYKYRKHETINFSESGLYFLNFRSAINFLENLTIDKLVVEEQIWDKYMMTNKKNVLIDHQETIKNENNILMDHPETIKNDNDLLIDDLETSTNENNILMDNLETSTNESILIDDQDDNSEEIAISLNEKNIEQVKNTQNTEKKNFGKFLNKDINELSLNEIKEFVEEYKCLYLEYFKAIQTVKK
ncbi:rab5 gdp/gtp exchange factor [Anaeramoeba flamelloides]|uniref:Rab5 gdp/gtp exchange factor n=1 Tax=Anaeramoeba flamelloides TaxID=1746091 RepID=A0ABQ8XW55_9EUKA|nr:rab5 gdp/gtp exchange factor [Anaeramoeba flamelloides]